MTENHLNYPWSGKIGRPAKACVVCGTDGPRWQLSSHALTCVGNGCRAENADPTRLQEAKAEGERRAREWCAERGMDYEAVKALFDAKTA